MRTRFPKVWCDVCKSMQFAGDCGHARIVRPSQYAFAGALTAGDALALELRYRWRELVLPPLTKWKLHPVTEILNDNAFALAAGPE